MKITPRSKIHTPQLRRIREMAIGIPVRTFTPKSAEGIALIALNAIKNKSQLV